MTEVPKIVYDRLRAAQPDQVVPERTHPDADLLAAFAEQMLSPAERDGVLDHLALCGNCREAIVLALPSADTVAALNAAGAETRVDQATLVHVEPRSSWRSSNNLAWLKLGWPNLGWPNLRWAVLAAAVVVVASVLVMHPGKLNQAPPGVNQQVATTAPAVSGAQIASSPAPTSIDQPVAGLAETAKTGEALAKQEVHESKKLYARSSMPRSTPAQSPMLFADNKMESAPGIPAAPPPAESLVLPSATNQVTTENAEVAEAPRDAAMPVPLAEGALMARNEAPVEKAKPAPQEIEAMDQQKDQPRTDLEKSKLAASLPAAKSPARAVTSSGAKLAGPQTNVKAVWAIAAGTLQRSLDSGQNWQNALRADRPLLCFAVQGKDVWAGGEAGTLFHSTDSGGTWVQVQPSIESRQLRSDITHIVLRNVVLRNDEGHFDDAHGSEDITVSTSNNQVWTSTDGGKTWQKQ